VTRVLVSTISGAHDLGVETVTRALAARGAEVSLLESDLFPTSRQLTIGWGPEDLLLHGNGADTIDLTGVSAVWLRHTDTADALPRAMNADHRAAARLESDAMVWGLLECIEVFQLDPPEAIRAAPYKPRQLQLARRSGLEIPRTVVTNDPARVREFAKTCPDGVIAKLVDGSLLGGDLARGVASKFTRRVGVAELEELASLRLSPMIFQELVPKALELRITVVGTRVFIAAIASAGSRADDWRADDALKTTMRPYEACPSEVTARILTLLTRLGLNFATIDMIVTPDGRHVFLELNTLSYFEFVERATGLPISDAIADLLLGISPSRIASTRPHP
jgi:glutathione synthase/RimK-type ligase-like ATP-grasp enzyme